MCTLNEVSMRRSSDLFSFKDKASLLDPNCMHRGRQTNRQSERHVDIQGDRQPYIRRDRPTEKHTDIQGDKQAYTETDRPAQRQTGRHRDRQTYRKKTARGQ